MGFSLAFKGLSAWSVVVRSDIVFPFVALGMHTAFGCEQ